MNESRAEEPPKGHGSVTLYDLFHVQINAWRERRWWVQGGSGKSQSQLYWSSVHLNMEFKSGLWIYVRKIARNAKHQKGK